MTQGERRGEEQACAGSPNFTFKATKVAKCSLGKLLDKWSGE